MRIGFIGLGNMSSAIIEGLKNSKKFDLTNIYASGRDLEKLKRNTRRLDINYCENNQSLIDQVDLIFLGVKPEDLNNLKLDFKNKIVISMAAKTNLKTLIKLFGNRPFVRIMPNLNVAINQGSIAYTSYQLNEEKNQEIITLLNLLGKVWVIDETKFSGFVALAGSLPALIYRFIDVISDTATEAGYLKAEALEIASHTISSSATYLNQLKTTPKELITKVASKNGTTEAGLNILNEKHFNEILSEAIRAIILKDKKGNS